MSRWGRSDDGVVAEDLAEYGLVLLMDEETGPDDLSAVRRGIAADAANEAHDFDEEDESSFVFVIPWYRRKSSLP
ncbi:MAG: hypothetical protein M3198_12545 [Actinomycetota bacterium]|nr:hypothetical protein [Actinomycetota bacterium]